MPNLLLADCFNQIDILIAKRSQLEQEKHPECLGKEDIELALQKLQHWVQSYVTLQDLNFACRSLLALSEAMNMGMEPSLLVRPSTSAPRSPSSSDRKSTQFGQEESVDFFVLETMFLMFAASNRSSLEPDSKSDFIESVFPVSEDVINFCMQKLHHECSSAIHHVACLCLAALSESYLSIILNKLNERLASAKKEVDFRDYTSFHKAVTYLQFKVDTTARLSIILRYLEDMLQLVKRVERGVLRAEVCRSWAAIFEGLLKEPGSKSVIEKSSSAPQLWILFDNIVHLVLKWSQRQKHALFCYELLTKIISLETSKADFIINHDRIWKWLMDALSQDSRKQCLELVLLDLRGLPKNALKSGILKESTVLLMIKKLLPKKFSPPVDEQTVTVNILIELARQNGDFASARIFLPFFQKPNSYATAEKTIVLKSLGKCLQESVLVDSSNILTLTPLIITHLEEANKDTEMLSAALTCVPYLHLFDPLKVARSIFRLTIHADRGTASAALLCLKTICLLHPAATLLYIVHGLADMLKAATHLRIDQFRLLHCCNNLVDVVQNVEVVIEKSPVFVANISQNDWTALRQHLEAIVMMALCHNEGWLRREALLVLMSISVPAMRALEAASNQPFLVDEFLGISDPVLLQVSKETFHVDLASLLEHSEKRTRFAEVISCAWCFMCGVASELFVDDVIALAENQEYCSLFHNQIRFLCLAFGSGSIRTRSIIKRKEFVDFDSALMDASPGSVKSAEFLRQVLDFLRKNLASSDHRPAMEQLARNLVQNLGLIDVLGYPALLRELQTHPSPSASMRSFREASSRGRIRFPDIVTLLFKRDICGLCSEAVQYAAEVFDMWLSEDDFSVFEGLPWDYRVMMLTCVRRALQFHHQGKVLLLEENKVDPVKAALRLLTRPGFVRSGDDIGEFRYDVNQALSELACLGPFKTEGLINKMLGVMHEMAMDSITEKNAHVTQQAFGNFLRSHPLYLSHFLKMSIYEVHGHDPRVPFKHVSLFYCTAIAKNWTESLPLYAKDDQRIASMLSFSLVHQLSSLAEARSLALRLAHELANIHISHALIVPFPIKLVTHPSFVIYSRVAQQYSESLASGSSYFKLIPALLYETASCFEFLNDEAKNRTLAVLLPWLCNLNSLFSRRIGEADAASQVSSILMSMFTITRFCFDSSACAMNLSDAWQNLMRSGSRKYVAWFVSQVVIFLENKFMIAASDEQHLIRAIFVYISRSACAQQAIDALMERFRDYSNFSQKLGSLRKWKSQPISVEERAAFELVIDIVFENHDLFTAHLSRLLMTACVLIPDASVCQSFLKKFIAGLSLELEEKDDCWENVINLISKQNPVAMESWSEACLNWICHSLDSHIVIQALLFYARLQKEIPLPHSDLFALARLEFVLCECLRTGLSSAIPIISLHFEADLPLDYNQSCFTMRMSAGRVLLEFTDYFNFGSNIIIKALKSSHVTNDWFLCLDKGKSFWAPDGTSAEQAIVTLLYKGLVTRSTFWHASFLTVKFASFCTPQTHGDDGLIMLALFVGFLSCLIWLFYAKRKFITLCTIEELEFQTADLLRLLQLYAAAESSPLKSTAFSKLTAIFLSLRLAFRTDTSVLFEAVAANFFASFHVLFSHSSRLCSVLPLIIEENKKNFSPIRPRVSFAARTSPSNSSRGLSEADVQPRLFRATLQSGINRPQDPKIELEIPVICFQCVEFLKLHLETVGLFRVPGNNKVIQDLKERFEQGNSVTLTEPNAVAGVLKLYFRELSESLLPEWMHAKIISMDDAKNAYDKLEIVKNMCKQLPNSNRLVLRYLLEFFLMVADKSSINKMDERNIAMVFAPNLNRQSAVASTPLELVRETAMQQKFIEFLMQHYTLIFEEEMLDPVTPRVHNLLSYNSRKDSNSKPESDILFNIVNRFFLALLSESYVDWRFIILVACNAFLLSEPDFLDVRQIQHLGEVVMLSYSLQEKETLRVAGKLARILSEKAFEHGVPDTVFNFLRPRAKRTKTGLQLSITESEQSCAFIDFYALPLVQEVFLNYESGKRLSTISTVSLSSSRDSISMDENMLPRMSISSGRRAPPPPPKGFSLKP